MKKLLIAMASLIIMMCYIASPLFVKPVYAASPNFTGLSNTPEDILSDVWSEDTLPNKYDSVSDVITYLRDNQTITNDDYFLYYVGYYNDSYYYTVAIDFQDADCTFENNVLTLTNVTGGSSGGKGITYLTDWYKNGGSPSITRVDQFDSCILNFNTLSLKFKDGNNYSLLDLDRYDCTKIWNIKSNIPDTLTSNNGLDLLVTVDGAYGFGGVITRKQTNSNGITSTADNLQFHVMNNGADAQWLFAIVPAGQSLDFTGWIWQGRDNIIGNPTYVYTCDEWVTLGLEGINIFDNSASANAVYCPSIWHSSESGSNRTYTVAYEAMNLTANANYQIVVYGCLNDNLEEMSGFYYDNNNLGSTYTVHGLVNDYQEVYRSLSFSITDPAVYNPNYTNPHDQSYPWDSNSDMHELFENGSAYRDEDGNIRIKGFKIGSSTYSWENDQLNTGSSSNSKNINVQQSFGGFFNLFNWFLTAIPKDYQLVIFFGVVAIVIVAIIKAVK